MKQLITNKKEIMAKTATYSKKVSIAFKHSYRHTHIYQS